MSLMAESTSNPSAAVRAAVQTLDPGTAAARPYPPQRALEHQTWFLRLFGKLFWGFAFIGLVMASVGIYAVIAQATSSRTQEIGVRMALGASVRNIFLLVMRRGLWQIAAGLISRPRRRHPRRTPDGRLPIGVSPSDPTVFLTVARCCAGRPVRLLAARTPRLPGSIPSRPSATNEAQMRSLMRAVSLRRCLRPPASLVQGFSPVGEPALSFSSTASVTKARNAIPR